MQYPAVALGLLLSTLSSVSFASAPEDASEPLTAQEIPALGEPSASNTIPACATGTWCIETLPITTAPLLHAVWAVSASDVFAVGDAGTILRRTGGAWLAMASGSTSDLRGVWALGSSNVWAVGLGGTILRFNGTAWSAVTGVTTSDIDAVWGSAANDVWLAGTSSVWHWNGATWTTFGFSGTLLAITGSGPSDVWATGENSFLHHWNGSTWTTVNPGAGTSTFFTVLSVSPTEVWASDFMPMKETVHLTAGKWATVRTNPSSVVFDGMSALASTDLWAAGGNRIGHWNGTAWTTSQPLGTSVALWSTAAVTGHVWVVGDNGLIAHQPL